MRVQITRIFINPDGERPDKHPLTLSIRVAKVLPITAIATLFFQSHHCLNGIIIIYLRLNPGETKQRS